MASKEIKKFVDEIDDNITFACKAAQRVYDEQTRKIGSLGNSMQQIMSKGQRAQLQLTLYAMTMVEEQKKRLSAVENQFNKINKKMEDLKAAGNYEDANYLASKIYHFDLLVNDLDVPGSLLIDPSPVERTSSMKLTVAKWKNFHVDLEAEKNKKIAEFENNIAENENIINKANKSINHNKALLNYYTNNYSVLREIINKEVKAELQRLNNDVLHFIKRIGDLNIEILNIQKGYGKKSSKKKAAAQDVKLYEEIINDYKFRIKKATDSNKNLTSLLESKISGLDENIKHLNDEIKTKELEIRNANAAIKAGRDSIEELKKGTK